MVRIWIGFLALSELLLSSLVHMLYGFYIFSTAVASDLLQALGECFRPNAEVVVKEVLSKESNLDGLPPIVLVHGIFGFGKGVMPYILALTFIFINSFYNNTCIHLTWGCLKMAFFREFFHF